jgi:GTPase SAR1 family protein
MRDINIVVVGATGVGKTTFIQRAHGLRLPPKTAISTKSMAIDSVPYTIRLMELNLSHLDIEGDRLIWPKQVSEVAPVVDGVLTLYDVMNPDSIANLAEVLSKCAFTYFGP